MVASFSPDSLGKTWTSAPTTAAPDWSWTIPFSVGIRTLTGIFRLAANTDSFAGNSGGNKSITKMLGFFVELDTCKKNFPPRLSPGVATHIVKTGLGGGEGGAPLACAVGW